jgi:glycosyltransferase involved in cell wall biosynthesis
MRILQVNKSYPPVIGGIENNVETLSEGLAERGTDVSVLVCNTEMRREIIEKEKLQIIKVLSPGKMFSMPIGPATPYWMSRLEADIMHIHMPYPMAVISALLTHPPCRYVVTWHSDIVRQKRLLAFFRPFLDRFMEKVDKIVATSPRMLEASADLQKYKDKVEIIHLGIDRRRFEPTPSRLKQAEKFRKDYGKPLVLFVGRLVGYKGLEYLIEAIDRVDGRLVIVGEGVLFGRLTDRALKKGLSGKVHFTGHVSDEDLAAWYHACDVFVLPSISNNETLGVVQLEAMFCERPVVSTNLPTGVPYANIDGKTGLVVPPKDAEALAGAIQKLLGNKALRDKMGRAGRQRIEENFTAEDMVNQMTDLYERVLKSPPPVKT